MRFSHLILVAAGVGWCVHSDSSLADGPSLVAGRSIDDYTLELSNPNRVVRLRAVKSLGAFGESAGEALCTALESDDKAVQYIAAVHLGRIAGKPLQAAKKRLESITTDKDSLAAAVAASFALCRAGESEKHLPLMIEALKYPERGMVCCTAELIGMLGPTAVAAIEPLEQAYQKHRPGAKGGDYHIGGAAMNALRKIKGE